MKKISILILLCICHYIHGQEFLRSDTHFEQVINNSIPFEDSAPAIIVVEFWAKFNEANAFNDWKKLTRVKYYRVNIGETPKTRQKYKILSLPHIIIFKDGYDEKHYKAGITFTLSVPVEEIQKRIDELLEASRF